MSPIRAGLTTRRHKDTFFTTMDGNFQNNEKDKPFDKSDFPITNGGGPMVEQTDAEKFKAKVKPQKDVSTLLSDGHDAIHIS